MARDKRVTFAPGKGRKMTAEEIKKLRKKLKLTQREFAARLKVEPTAVSKWENTERKPRGSCLRRLERLARTNENN